MAPSENKSYSFQKCILYERCVLYYKYQISIISKIQKTSELEHKDVKLTSVCLSVCLSVRLSVCLSLCLYVWWLGSYLAAALATRTGRLRLTCCLDNSSRVMTLSPGRT